MTIATYACEHRPPASFTLPQGFTDLSTEPLTGHLAEVGRHGTATFPQRLSARDAQHFSLWLVLSLDELAAEIAAEVDYPEEQLELRAEEPRYFEQIVGQIADEMVVRADASRQQLADAVAARIAA